GRVSASQTLFDWSSVARVRAAGAQADGSRAERGVTVEGTALTAALAYLRAVRAQAVVAARQADSTIAAELVGLAEAQKAARQSGSAIRAERLPRVEVAADYGVNGLTVPSAIATRDLTLQVSVPILDGFRREARLAEQDAVVRESQVREHDLRQQIAADVD